MPPDFDRQTEGALCCRKIFAASADRCTKKRTVSQSVRSCLIVPMLPYFQDLAPADFFLFPKLKSSLKGRRFQTVEEIEEHSTRYLHAIPQNTFQDAFQNWKKREQCIKSEGEYFEGNKRHYVVCEAIN